MVSRAAQTGMSVSLRKSAVGKVWNIEFKTSDVLNKVFQTRIPWNTT